MTLAASSVCSLIVATGELGRLLREKRESTLVGDPATGRQRKMTAEEAGELFGVHQSTYSRWEQGDFFPEPGPRANQIAVWLGMTTEQLYQLKRPEVGPNSDSDIAARLTRVEQSLDALNRRFADAIERLERVAQDRDRQN